MFASFTSGFKGGRMYKFLNIAFLLTLRFTSFPIVFQSYQDDEQVTMKGCILTHFATEKISASGGAQTRNS